MTKIIATNNIKNLLWGDYLLALIGNWYIFAFQSLIYDA